MSIRISDVFAITGRGVGVTSETDATDEMVLEINAAQRLARPFPPPRRLSVRGYVGDVPNRPPLFPGRGGIQVSRPGGEYSAFIPLTGRDRGRHRSPRRLPCHRHWLRLSRARRMSAVTEALEAGHECMT